MRADTENLISVTELGRNASKIINETARDGQPRVVLRNNKVAAVIVSAAAAERLGELEELVDDLQLWALALVRSATDSGDRHDLDDVIAELGIDLDED